MGESFIDKELIFEEDKIYFLDSSGKQKHVMMSWEDSLMKKHADYICQNGGDILELGFGMGIAADYIQANNPASHTIVENHPQVIEKAKAWAVGKPNVTIVEGDWFNKLSELSTYDGIFADTYGDEHVNDFAEHLPSLVKENGLATWWNNSYTESTIIDIEGVEFDTIDVTPTENSYFNNDKYYLPKKQF
tara:strand:- start:26573 stop:27142 length:570 start_codon:yes stop_codon:yes gene_type:complete